MNVASLNAERRLRESTSSLGKSYERLSSGLRINRAGDDAAGLSVSASLIADARLFTQAVRNTNDVLSFLGIADGATSALKDVLIRMRELSTQASNGTLGDPQRQALDEEAQALVGEYNRILRTTEMNGINPFADNGFISVQAGYSQVDMYLGEVVGGGGGMTLVGDGSFQPRTAFATGSTPNR